MIALWQPPSVQKLPGVGLMSHSGLYSHTFIFVAMATQRLGQFSRRKARSRSACCERGARREIMPRNADYFLPGISSADSVSQRGISTHVPHRSAVSFLLRSGGTRRGCACGKGNKNKPDGAHELLKRARARVRRGVRRQPCSRVLKVAAPALEARLAKDDRAAIEHWKRAVAAEDALNYDEPPTWYYPVRESLGGALLRTGQPAEAETVFREDLKRNPRNGRSLFA